MAISMPSMRVVAALTAVFAMLLRSTHAMSEAPAPAPTSDGTTLDQGIAYVLMVVALVLTYLIHPLDSSLLSPYKFF